MNRKASLLSALALLLGTAACAPSSTDRPVHAAAEAAVPTAEGVVRRCAERWSKIVAASDNADLWVDVYAYETPEQKQRLSLPAFLSGKENFVYADPTEPKLLLMEDDLAYVDVSAKWLAGRHPMIGTAKIGGDPDMVEPMDVIETWQWVDGQWHFSKITDKGEFLRQNPDFLARAQAASSGSAK